jgi:transcriptional regulator with XRE-family HTH domain
MAAEVRVPQPIAALLLERGVTAESVARVFGLSPATTRRLLDGSLLPTPEQAARFSQYIDEPEDVLFYPPRREAKYHPKPCRSCRAEFQPNNPNNAYCPACRARRAS